MNVIETKKLCYLYEDSQNGIHDVDIQVRRKQTVAILGGNGAGKSTLFLNLNGVLKPLSGEVLFHGEPVKYNRKSILELRKRIGIVFQDPDDQLFSASVYKDISFGAINLKLTEDEVRRRVDAAVEQTGIAHLIDKPTHELSYGQKKRVAIAGVLVMQPELIILDEPTAGLDPKGVSEIMDLLNKIKEETHVSVILATHDMDMVPLYADYIYCLNSGRVAFHGITQEIFSSPGLLRDNGLRLSRIAHLIEILNHIDHMDIDVPAPTISTARAAIKNMMNDYMKKQTI